MAEIRAFRRDDLDDLYRICLATAANAAAYRDSRLVGHVYAAPYAILCPRSVLVIEDAEGVGGYILGAVDTRNFEARLEAEWWPGLRKAYSDPSDVPRGERNPDQRMIRRIHHPLTTPSEIVADYPSHLHINLLPRLRGRGFGRRLMAEWLGRIREMGSRGAHLAVGATNLRAIRFYRACGFRELTPQPTSDPIWFGLNLMDRPRTLQPAGPNSSPHEIVEPIADVAPWSILARLAGVRLEVRVFAHPI
jgi:ribosomal protein S18 acetylase RimI-like enzyme